MVNIAKLIESAGDQKLRSKLSSEIASEGKAAVEPLVNAIRAQTGPSQLLPDVLLQIRDPEAADSLLALIGDESISLRLASLRALGYLGNRSAVPTLEKYLQDEEKTSTVRELAAQSLGELRSDSSRVPLATVMSAAMQSKEYELSIACAISLAKLGDNSGFATIKDAANLKSKPTIRAAAAAALKYVTGPEMREVLKRALEDKNVEVRRACLEPWYLLGNVVAGHALASAAYDRDHEVAFNAPIYLCRMTKATPPEKKIDAWWKDLMKTYKADTCYRLGEPIRLSLFHELLDIEGAKEDVIREVSIYTGEVFGSPQYIRANLDVVSRLAKELIKKDEKRYEVGAVYKTGRKVELAGLMQPG